MKDGKWKVVGIQAGNETVQRKWMKSNAEMKDWDADECRKKQSVTAALQI